MGINQNIKVAVDAVVFSIIDNQKQILLIERKHKAGENSWALPGGFIEDNETPLQAVSRELEEETGIIITHFKQLHAFGAVNRDPRFRVISIAHVATTDKRKHTLKANSDAKEARWFDIDKSPNLAFDHKEIVEMAVEQL
ncbi:MAG: NUDIX hydrolase [Brumimicrobium sp.]